MRKHKSKIKVEINLFGQIHIIIDKLHVFYASDTLEITHFYDFGRGSQKCKSLDKIPRYCYQIAVKNQSEGLMNLSQNCYKKRFCRKMKNRF